jgi:quercetin dioxygenase-like cupin family protein
MNVEAIQHEGRTFARLMRGGEWSEGLQFFSDDSDFLQVGKWSYPAGKELPAHYHNEVPRQVLKTQEVVYVVSGALEAHILTASGELVTKLHLSAGDLLVVLDGAHGYHILEDDTRVIEIKNGPYMGAEQDRTRI